MSVAPAYGGDEVNALVLDPGTSLTRIGFAGEDTPKCVLPSSYGVTTLAYDELPDAGKDRKKYHFGDINLSTPKPHKEILNLMANGMVEDFDASLQLWQYGFESALGIDVRDHPVLITECAWNESKKREKTLEIMMEQFDVPAAYLARNAVCSAFAGGKATALCVDVGAGVTSVTPVVDGMILRKGIQHSQIAGDFISSAARQYFQQESYNIRPSYLISRKVQVDSNTPSQAVLKTFDGITPSFQSFHEEKVLLEWKESCAAILERGFDAKLAATRPTRAFEFPDGFNTTFGAERFRIPETLFNPGVMGKPADNLKGLPQLLHASIAGVDADVRAQLFNNVLVTGGSTLIPGFTDRLTNEIQAIAPGSKVRIHAAGNTAERKFGAWLGGSILASLGTFHQMWISKAEYDESGPVIVEKRCR